MQTPHFSGVPSFFQACCRDVRHRTVNTSYSHPGRELTRHLPELIPYDVEPGAWEVELDNLSARIADHDDDAVIAWFVRWFPACMALVPKRRREGFVEGVYDAPEW